jgi:two-component system response regulator ChvI
MTSALSAKLLVVDDDDLFRESLTRNLSDAGFAVADFPDGPTVLDHLAGGSGGDLAIIDWRMPVMNGIEVLRRMRAEGHALPVVFLTSLSEQIYEEAALATGAVDFVEKSRSFGIVLKRLKLILDGSKAGAGQAKDPAAGTETDALVRGDIVLRERTGRAFWREAAVDLTLTEFKMVLHMVRNAGEDVSYRSLYDLVHGAGFNAGIGAEGYRANVRTFLKRIRQKFRAVDPEFDQILNYTGFGYRWKADDEEAVG